MKLSNTIGAICIASSVAMSAWALDTAPPAGNPASTACKQDMQALCKDVKPGEGRVKECMKAHRDQLSAGCKAAIKANHQQGAQAPATSPPANPPPGK